MISAVGAEWHTFTGSSWAVSNPEESHETFDHFLQRYPQFPRGRRNTIRLLIDSTLNNRSPKIASFSQDTIEHIVGLPCSIDLITLNDLPESAWRKRQLRTRSAFEVISGYFKSDDFCVLLLTDKDLCPYDDTNFVFGEACEGSGRAIVSTSRYSIDTDPERDGLTRLCKILSHEVFHLLGLPHCLRWECNMNGKNSLDEVNDDPLTLCPDCLSKLCYSIDREPEEYLKEASHFLFVHNLDNAKDFETFSSLVSRQAIIDRQQ